MKGHQLTNSTKNNTAIEKASYSIIDRIQRIAILEYYVHEFMKVFQTQHDNLNELIKISFLSQIDLNDD